MLYSSPMRWPTVIFVLFLFLAGCSEYSPEELDRLIKEDPSFRQMILARDQIHSQMRLIRADLLNKKKTMDGQVERLHQDYDSYAKAQNEKIEKYQSTIEVNKSLLKRDAETASAQLQAKITEADGYQKTLSDVRKVLGESKGIHFSAQEKEKWQERVAMLTEKLRPLADEVNELKLQIRLKKQKMGFLK